MIEAAITALRQRLGDEHTVTDAAALERYGWCTIPLRRRVAAVVRPGCVEDVQEVVRIAGAHGVPIYPISTGNNWGYGSAQPVRDDNVILDLGRLNRIVELNTELAYAVLEPGVTQRQLYDHLQTNRIPLRLNPTGAGPSCSVLGNTLERGFGIGPNGDHFLAQCGMEVVLANGDVLRTGFGHYPGAHSTFVYKWGVGPYLDGLFTQSNYGIVTKIGVWLRPAPECFEACYWMCHSEEQLGPVIDAVRRLLFDGVFDGPINLLHRNRVLVMLTRYPWEEMSGQTPLRDAIAERVAARKKIGVWNGVGAICGSGAQVRGARDTIRRALKGKVDRLLFLSDARLNLLRRYPRAIGRLLKMDVSELLVTLQSSFGLMKGVPSEVALSLAYWRNKRPPSAAEKNPARDGCGLMWFAPIIPLTRDHVSAFRGIIEPIVARHGFEACITLTAVNARCFDCTLPLLYNRDDPDEVHRAQACHDALLQACLQHGYVPYRLGLQSMQAAMMPADDVFWRVVSRVKGALDPQGVLAPGRYSM